MSDSTAGKSDSRLVLFVRYVSVPALHPPSKKDMP